MKKTFAFALLAMVASSSAFANNNERRIDVFCKFDDRPTINEGRDRDRDRCFAHAVLYVRDHHGLNEVEPSWANQLRVKCDDRTIYNNTARVSKRRGDLLIGAVNRETPLIKIDLERQGRHDGRNDRDGRDRDDRHEFDATLFLRRDALEGQCKFRFDGDRDHGRDGGGWEIYTQE